MAVQFHKTAALYIREKFKQFITLAIIFCLVCFVSYIYYSRQEHETPKSHEIRINAFLDGLVNVRTGRGAYYLIWECEEDKRHDLFVYEVDSSRTSRFELKGVLQRMKAFVDDVLPEGVEQSYHLPPETETIFLLIEEIITENRKVSDVLQLLSELSNKVKVGIKANVVTRVVERWQEQGRPACDDAVSLLATPSIWRELTRRLWAANFVRIDQELQRAERRLEERALSRDLIERLDAMRERLLSLRPSEVEGFDEYDPKSADFAALDTIRLALLDFAREAGLPIPRLTGDKPWSGYFVRFLFAKPETIWIIFLEKLC